MIDLFEVKLKRAGRKAAAIIVPHSVKTIKRSLEDEQEGHRKAVAPTLSLTFYTDDIQAFLTPYPTTAEEIDIEVKYYQLFDETTQYLVFVGVGENFPIDNIKFNDETTTIELTSVVLTWESDEPSMKDGDDYYKFISIADALVLFDSVYKTNKVESII